MALRFGLCVNDYEAMAEYYRIMCDDETHQPIVVRKQLHDYVHTRVYVPDGCPYMLEQIASNYVKQQETVSGRCKLWLERLYAKI